jgi:hypothetical protein
MLFPTLTVLFLLLTTAYANDTMPCQSCANVGEKKCIHYYLAIDYTAECKANQGVQCWNYTKCGDGMKCKSLYGFE